MYIYIDITWLYVIDTWNTRSSSSPAVQEWWPSHRVKYGFPCSLPAPTV